MNHFEVDKQRLAIRRLRIGRGAGCELRLRDPVVADRHCTIEFDRAGFLLHDADSPTGTYLNSRRVPADRPALLAAGDVVTIGTSRLRIELKDDGTTCAVTAEERKFHFQKAASATGPDGKPVWQPGDREQWRESEVAFGAFPLLWNLVWGAVAVGVLAVVATLLPGGRMLMQPGRLDAAHAGIADCEACHESFGGAPTEKCLKCHESVRPRHPVPREGSTGGIPFDCASCHREHQGTARRAEQVAVTGHAYSATVLRRDPRFVPSPGDLEGSCTRCHPVQPEPLDEEKTATKEPVTTVLEAVPYDRFDHKAHLARAIDCDRCHRPNAQRTNGLDRDFVRFDYAGCMTCHAERQLAAERVSIEFDAERDAPKLRRPGDWHGYERDASHCRECHAGDPKRDKRTKDPITRRRHTAPANFAVPDRLHRAEFAAHAEGEGACTKCHVGGVPAGQRRQAPFDHGSHLSDPPVARAVTADDAARLEAQCRDCHREILTAHRLADPYEGPTAGDAEHGACASCHDATPAAAAAAATAPVTQADFPHDLHLARDNPLLADGCLSCHRFAAVAGDGPIAMTTPADKKDCRTCHDEKHAVLGGGACAKCHTDLDPAFRGRPEDPAWPWHRTRTRFSHFSEGHIAELEKPCTGCHDQITEATTITGIVDPPADRESCRNCHVTQRRRFHRPR